MKTGRILCHPFHNGLEGVGMGAGPSRLLGDAAFVDELRAADWRIETIEAPQAADPEIVRIAEADRRLARRVRARASGGVRSAGSRRILLRAGRAGRRLGWPPPADTPRLPPHRPRCPRSIRGSR